MKQLNLIILSLIAAISVHAQTTLYGDSLKQVTITPYIPKSATQPTPAIIIFPGGSYCWLAVKGEGHSVAEWFEQQGIAAFVVTYRVVTPAKFATGARVFTGERLYPKMLNDAEQAVKYVRQHSELYNINPRQVGTIGFSAGGHLSLMLGERCVNDSLTRPDFTAAIYPVVTFSDRRHTHHRTRRAALGIWHQGNKIMRDSLSLEKHVPDNMPPTFLLCCKDDKTVDYENTVMMDSALTRHGIPHQTVIYNHGDHGFGGHTEKFTPETAQWQETFLKWLKEKLKVES